jgi:hypothetical protein
VDVDVAEPTLVLLPAPEPDEVVTSIRKELQIAVEIEPFRLIAIRLARPIPSWRLLLKCDL